MAVELSWRAKARAGEGVMKQLRFLSSMLVLASSLVLAAPAEFEQLDPETQAFLGKVRDDWHQLSPERRDALVQRVQEWKNLPPEQREALRARHQRFRQLPPEEQEALRKKFSDWRKRPPEEREALREKWRRMSPEEKREAARRGGFDRDHDRPGAAPDDGGRKEKREGRPHKEKGRDKGADRESERDGRDWR